MMRTHTISLQYIALTAGERRTARFEDPRHGYIGEGGSRRRRWLAAIFNHAVGKLALDPYYWRRTAWLLSNGLAASCVVTT